MYAGCDASGPMVWGRMRQNGGYGDGEDSAVWMGGEQ